MHFNLSVWDFLATCCYIIIFGFFSRYYSAKYPDSILGKALAVVN